MSVESTTPSSIDLSSDTFLPPGFNTVVKEQVIGLNRMGCSFSKIQLESSSSKSSSPTQPKPTTKLSISTVPLSSIYSDEAAEACAQLKSLGGMTARLRSQFTRVLNEAYWQQHLATLSLTHFSTGTGGKK